ncbi:hypothetical protein ABIA06_006464 [Bradyrhizobium yuanmingense]|uniref:Uncharacterized protein n=1 Tax=Bradyrhizobium yuanmingense TaxID=108015 RepID=A0A1C3WV05_9BRAD|nr:hypothetical protein IQ15_05138 [Bradyrhizobium yuanmingense]SCB43857.1 hypothetical protein GA0061099_1007380 [Bradyrhizobium yuanmingense]
MERSAIRGSSTIGKSPDSASLHPGYGLEAAPLPKRGHVCIGRVLGSIGLAEPLKNGSAMVLRDLEGLTLRLRIGFRFVLHAPTPDAS